VPRPRRNPKVALKVNRKVLANGTVLTSNDTQPLPPMSDECAPAKAAAGPEGSGDQTQQPKASERWSRLR
jgi:hypothetical protein